MATCKDCLHFDICEEYAGGSEYLPKYCCEDFKARSRFVELPSEAFTIVFGKVSAGRIDSANILLKNSTAWIFDSSHIGKEIFFTREEAEQALKEREKI